MKTAKVFESGNSQAVRLPKEFRVGQSLVWLKRIGDNILIMPKKPEWSDMELGAASFSEDFFAGGRDQGETDKRDPL